VRNKTLKGVYDKIRVLSLNVFVFFILFIIQKYTIGLIPGIRNIIIFNKFYFHEILFSIISIIIIKFYIKVDIPDNNQGEKFFTIKKIEENCNLK